MLNSFLLLGVSSFYMLKAIALAFLGTIGSPRLKAVFCISLHTSP